MRDEPRNAMNDPGRPTPGADLPPELRTLEAQLSSLRPATGRLDRDRLMYLAGQASAARAAGHRGGGGMVRQGLVAIASAAAAVAVTVLVWQPAPRVVERVVYQPAPTPPKQAATAEPVHRESSPPGADRFEGNGEPSRILAGQRTGEPEPAWGPSRRQLARILAEGLDALPSTESRGSSGRPEACLSRQSLTRLLEEAS